MTSTNDKGTTPTEYIYGMGDKVARASFLSVLLAHFMDRHKERTHDLIMCRASREASVVWRRRFTIELQCSDGTPSSIT